MKPGASHGFERLVINNIRMKLTSLKVKSSTKVAEESKEWQIKMDKSNENEAMGNCQAAEAAAVVIMHPGNNKIERIYNSVSARHVMSLNPGHYVGVIVTMQGPQSQNRMPIKKLKLLRPDDMLLIDVLKEFAAKKCVKLGKLLKERGVLVLEKKGRPLDSVKEPNASSIKYYKRIQELDRRLGAHAKRLLSRAQLAFVRFQLIVYPRSKRATTCTTVKVTAIEAGQGDGIITININGNRS
ncbi:hypothetical protein Tco_1210918 [Tanacetum coccineum]